MAVSHFPTSSLNLFIGPRANSPALNLLKDLSRNLALASRGGDAYEHAKTQFEALIENPENLSVLKQLESIPALPRISQIRQSLFKGNSEALQLVAGILARHRATVILEEKRKVEHKNGSNGHVNGYRANGVQNGKTAIDNLNVTRIGQPVLISSEKIYTSVLFTDLAGFSTLSKGQSAEKISERIRYYMSRLQPILTRLKAIIPKTIGDAIMAYFKELRNTAITAVQAAVLLQKEMDLINDELRRLALNSQEGRDLLKVMGRRDVHDVTIEDIKNLMEGDQLYAEQVEYMLSKKRLNKKLEELSQEQIANFFIMKIDPLIFDQRVGVESGEVVEETYSDGRKDIIGDVVNAANRMESLAPIGGICIGEATRRGCGDYFEYEERGKIEAKGIGMIGAFNVTRELTKAERQTETLQRRLTIQGREREIQLLRTVFDKAVTEKKAQMVMIQAGAGEGKTALAYEFKNSLGDLEPHILDARAQDLVVSDANQVFIEMLRTETLVDLVDEPETQRSKVNEFLRELFGFQDKLESINEEILSYHLGITIEKESAELRALKESGKLKEKFYDLIAKIFRALCHQKPLILAIDDIQWADENTKSLIHFLLTQLKDEPFMVLAMERSAREETSSPHGDSDVARWKSGPFDFHLVSLEELSLTHSRAMIVEIMAEKASSEIVSWIREKAGSNPMYVRALAEELVRRGIDDVKRAEREVRVPKEIREFLESLMGELGEEEQQVLKYAAVMGREFQLDALIGLGITDPESILKYLIDRNFILRVGDGEYQFRHDLRREAVLAKMVSKERREVHAYYAGYLVKSGSKEFLSIAGHFEQGGKTEDASEFYRKAAWSIAEGGGTEEAEKLFLKSDQLTTLLSNKLKILWGRYDLQFRAQNISRQLEIIRIYSRLLINNEKVNINDEAGILYRIGKTLSLVGKFPEAEEKLQMALKLVATSQETDSIKIRGNVLVMLALTQIYMGKLEGAEVNIDMALTLAEQQKDYLLQGRALMSKNKLEESREHYSGGLRASGEALQIYRQKEDFLRTVDGLGATGGHLMRLGLYKEASADLREAEGLAGSLDDNILNFDSIYLNQCRTLYFLGDSEVADCISRLEKFRLKYPNHQYKIYVLTYLAQAYLKVKDHIRAEQIALGTKRDAEASNDDISIALADMVLAQIAHELGKVEEEDRLSENSFKLLEGKCKSKISSEFDLDIYLIRAKSLVEIKKFDEAIRILKDAKSILQIRVDKQAREHRDNFRYQIKTHGEIERLLAEIEGRSFQRNADILEFIKLISNAIYSPSKNGLPPELESISVSNFNKSTSLITDYYEASGIVLNEPPYAFLTRLFTSEIGISENEGPYGCYAENITIRAMVEAQSNGSGIQLISRLKIKFSLRSIEHKFLTFLQSEGALPEIFEVELKGSLSLHPGWIKLEYKPLLRRSDLSKGVIGSDLWGPISFYLAREKGDACRAAISFGIRDFTMHGAKLGDRIFASLGCLQKES